MWEKVEEKVHKTLITDLDELKEAQRLRTECATLNHVVIAAAAAIRQWRRRLSACDKAGGGHFEHHL